MPEPSPSDPFADFTAEYAGAAQPPAPGRRAAPRRFSALAFVAGLAVGAALGAGGAAAVAWAWTRESAGKPPPAEAPAPEEAVAGEKDRLRGAWVVVGANGNPIDWSKGALLWRIQEDGGVLERGAADGSHSREGTLAYMLHPTESPKAIDIHWKSGEASGKTCLGIYRLEAFDKLLICLADPGKDRPTDFTPREDAGRLLLQLRRFDSFSFDENK
jgi:uncharacterized protein (TIGR03067 family)